MTAAMPTASVDEVERDIYRISVAAPNAGPAGFTFNQFLIVDDRPMLFHTGHRKLFPVVRAAVERVLPVAALRYIAFSHVEADECGALNEFLAAAPSAEAVCSGTAARTSINDATDRPPKAMADGETLSLGKRQMRWYDAPHVPHGWECGYMAETTSKTLFCGDLFTQGGIDHPAITEGDILTPSEALRSRLEYYAHARNTRAILGRLAADKPTSLACMHGSVWRGDGAALLGKLADALERS